LVMGVDAARNGIIDDGGIDQHTPAPAGAGIKYGTDHAGNKGPAFPPQARPELEWVYNCKG